MTETDNESDESVVSGAEIDSSDSNENSFPNADSAPADSDGKSLPNENSTAAPVDSDGKSFPNENSTAAPVDSDGKSLPNENSAAAPVDSDGKSFPNENSTAAPVDSDGKSLPNENSAAAPVDSDGKSFPNENSTAAPVDSDGKNLPNENSAAAPVDSDGKSLPNANSAAAPVDSDGKSLPNENSAAAPVDSNGKSLPNANSAAAPVGPLVSAGSRSKSKWKKLSAHSSSESFKLRTLVDKIFDEKFPIGKKIKLFHRLATIKNGTVQVEVPADIKPQSIDTGVEHVKSETIDEDGDDVGLRSIPPLQIVILIVGTRGDVQPFVAIGKCLQENGHRVRLATHANFKDFVLSSGLEFFPLGGDPKILAEYMVKHKGFLPSEPSELLIQRQQLKDIIFSLLPACRDPDPITNVPFNPDAIIANPPAYGHSHVAEALKVPLHIFFTMPWTPTKEFPHPLSRVKHPVAYKLSYQIVDWMIWLGIRDMIADFRKYQLKLRPANYLSGYYSSPHDVPHGYIWSPHLVPKAKDWGPKIDVVGFCFLDLASDYEPPDALVKWLEREDDPPIYVGFGSLPVQEPERMTQIIVSALEQTGQRGIINKGWGGLGNLAEPKESVYLLDNCPHDWLFTRCKAVVHHGGAGTTAAGLKAACPTTIVPFFGDQPFWGDQVHARGLGPAPIQVDEFSLEKLVDAIRYMINPEVKNRAVELAKALENEDGARSAVQAFYKHFPRKQAESAAGPPKALTTSSSAKFGLSKYLGCFAPIGPHPRRSP